MLIALPHLMPKENPVPSGYVKLNQEHWRNAERGRISRPLEMAHTADFLHRRMVKTFNLEDAHQPILTWSVLFDRPKTPSTMYVYAERVPEEIGQEDAQSYTIGMGRITEYATNYAMREFIRRNMDIPLLRDLGSIYGRIADLATYEILLNGTYRRMAQVESLAEQNGKDYTEAITQALFQHNFDPLNELVLDTKEFSGWLDISDVAIEIGGRRFKKPDLGKWLDRLEVEEKDGPIKTGVKNTLLSVVAGGVFRSPGITEISGGITGVIFAETAVVYAANLGRDIINNPELLGSVIPVMAENLAIASVPLISLTPAVAIHEAIHSYSSNKDYMGLIPAKLISKKTIPYLARLEPEE